jgi:glutathione peroxidase
MTQNIYQFTCSSIAGEEVSLQRFSGKVLLIVNVASECGFTRQYAALEELYKLYRDQGLVVLGFPCDQFGGQEPGTDNEILEFCQTRFNVSFPLFSKLYVNGSAAHPLYEFLKNEKSGVFNTKRIKWNFTKFLVSRQGDVLKRYSPSTKPMDLKKDIEKLL